MMSDEDDLYQIRRMQTIMKMLDMCQWIDEKELVSRVNHPSAQDLVRSWVNERKIFSVPTPRGTLYPEFQFDSKMRPREIVKKVLSEFANKDSVSTAAWFLFRNGWISTLIDGTPESLSPRMVLDNGEAVLNAARREVKCTNFS